MKFKSFIYFALLILLVSCSMKALEPNELQELKTNDEFDQAIKVEAIPPPVEVKEANKETVTDLDAEKNKQPKLKQPRVAKNKKTKHVRKKNKKKRKEAALKPHLPDIEDGENFDGRRPLFDPFIPGQSAIMTVAFTGISAGTVELRVNPFVEVNGKKAYFFSTHAKTNKFFSLFYKVNDWAETYLDYEQLIPYSFSLHVRESKQYREARTLFDWKTMTAKHWEKKNRGGKKSEKKQEWKILPYSQNVITAFYYLRLFKYEVGKKLAFRVADNGKNMIVRLDVVRREKVSVGAGEFDAHVAKVQFEYDGVFKQTGDIYAWIIDDQYQHLAKIEAAIKIGTMSLSLDEIVN